LTFYVDINEAMFSMGEYVAHGASGVVEQRERVVTKRPYSNNASLEELEIEARIYRHLGPHPREVKISSWDHEEFIPRTEYMKNGNLKSFINSNQSSTEKKSRWIKQAGDTVQVLQKALLKPSPAQFLHSQSVIRCDIKPDNFLLDENLDLKVCDFAGSSLYGSKALVCWLHAFLAFHIAQNSVRCSGRHFRARLNDTYTGY
jgi:serine/threonine protein kinase